MILWCDGAHGPVENMRRDQALLEAAEAGTAPVLRLFTFLPHGVTLGRNQVPDRELDLARCRADGVEWAVRPTGGRAIFHAEEWTYSLAAPNDDREWGGGAADTYARASEVILKGLVRLGVPAVMVARRTPGATPGPRARSTAAPCFASTARHEVTIERRKLVGSAQRRTAHAWLQQGSILLGDGHLRLADYLAIPDGERETMRESLRRSAGTAGPWLGVTAPIARLADALHAELGPRSHRLDGAAGGSLLTVSGSGSYTAPFV